MKKEEAVKMINRVDKARNSYHKHFAKYAQDDPQHKDMIVNSSLLGVEGTARALAAIAGIKFGAGKFCRPGNNITQL